MSSKISVSVVIPVYNSEEYLRKCLDEVVKQSINKSKLEVILIDDGSTDSSPEICDEYAEKYSYINVFHIENGGVSNARNIGIEKSNGKYIMFLDSDDWLHRKSIQRIVDFFDKHYDEIDIMTYTEMIYKNGVIKPVYHFRYKFVNQTGVYDLTDPDYMYFVQTHMNICIKNKGSDTAKFDTSMIFHEDQKFILSILADKHKIGFCKEAVYYYFQNANGASGNKSHPYYIFDKTIEFWESFFKTDNVPKYVQAYYMNDFRWKLKNDVLWPYQYKGEEFEKQKKRLIDLIKKVDDDVILDYPWMIRPHKVYIMDLKYGDKIHIETDEEEYRICIGEDSLFEFENIEIYVPRFHINHGYLTMVGAIKCLACNFTDDISGTVTFTENGEEKTEPLILGESSLSICASKTVTNNYQKFIIRRPLGNLTSMNFRAKLNGREYPVHLSFPGTCPLNRVLKRTSYICENLNIYCTESAIMFKPANVFNRMREFFRVVKIAKKIGYRNALTKIKAPSYKKKHRIWLYCDSSKTVKDNAYYQFIHDIKKKDGIERYYVYNTDADIDGWFDDSMKPYLVPYGSLKHRLYGLSAEKILTSFYGLRDMLSYPSGAMKYFADLTNFDVIYLQHGVLHANLPTMYSIDRMMLDKEVISTYFEEQSLKKNYGFDDEALIKCGMPRYNHIDTTKKAEKKILFAPSWRKFLVQPDGKGSWKPKEKAFLDSDFYKVTSAFLKDERLISALKKHGYVLDFKMHPNFRMYDDLYELDGETVRIADTTVDEFSYSIFITDFSSFVFDFIYLKRPILYFVPDMDLFEAGLNHYRKLDIPFEEGFGEFSTMADKAIENIIALLENDCVPEQKYVDRMNGLFFPVDDNSEALYQELTKGISD